MKRWVLILEGGGQGCDYTIGCGIAVNYIQAETEAQALEKVKVYLEGYGRSRIESISLYPETAEVAIPYLLWEEARQKAEEREEAREQEAKDRAELARLQAKLGVS